MADADEIGSRSRLIKSLIDEEFDVLVIGGGIFGAMTALQACHQGLKVALIEKGDFGSGSSANSYKIIHGGIRYIQHLDLPRVIASCAERSAFLRNTPHLCETLPIIIPTYGWGRLGKVFLGAGCLFYDLVTVLRNRRIRDRSRRVGLTQFLSKERVLKEYPDIEQDGLTGACLIQDGRFKNPTRLVWDCCYTSQDLGAKLGNYVCATGLLLEGRSVKGIYAKDVITNKEIQIRSKVVVNAMGPWAESWLKEVTSQSYKPSETFSRDVCFVIDRPSEQASKFTLAMQGSGADPDALVARQKRHLFLSPWRNKILVGVWHKVTKDSPDSIKLTKEEALEFIKDTNEAYSDLNLTLEDVCHWNMGLVPFGKNQKSEVDLSYGKRSNLIDHAKLSDIDNLITIVGVRYTMARAEAEKVIELTFKKLGLVGSKKANTRYKRLSCSNYDTLDSLNASLIEQLHGILTLDVIEELASNYGSNAYEVATLIHKDNTLSQLVPGSLVTLAELIYVCRNEMVENLSDVVFRRTTICTAGHPGDLALAYTAKVVGTELNWSSERVLAEIDNVLLQLKQELVD